MKDSEKAVIDGIVSRDSHYPAQAYEFVAEGVQYTVRRMMREEKDGLERHVTGAELIRGILEFAAARFGFLAPEVFEYWRFRSGRDIGNTVYAMIGAKLLSASPNDRIEDFDGMPDLPARLRGIIETAGNRGGAVL